MVSAAVKMNSGRVVSRTQEGLFLDLAYISNQLDISSGIQHLSKGKENFELLERLPGHELGTH